MAAITYLNAPVKAERNATSDKPDVTLWLASTVALGALTYYAPKTFLVACAGIVGYQVYRFNQLVSTADITQHQQIRTWTLNACVVMSAIGSVFLLKSLPCAWDALKDIRHLHVIRSIGHLVQAIVFIGIGTCFDNFSDSAKTLASQRRWVAMEDYVENYPQDIKQDVLSTPWKQLGFYISAVIPQTLLAGVLSARNFVNIQFSSIERKESFVLRYFGSATQENWALAIHQIQQLPAATQLSLAHELAKTAAKQFQVEEQNAFPNDIKALLIHARLKDFKDIPTQHDDSYGEWMSLMHDFQQLDLDAQEILGNDCLLLLRGGIKQNETSNEIRLAALKAIPLLMYKLNITSDQEIADYKTLADALFDSLLPVHKTNLGAFLKKSLQDSTIYYSHLSEEIKAVIPIGL